MTTSLAADVGFVDGAIAQNTLGLARRQPHVVAWDGTRGALHVAGLGNDTIIQLWTGTDQSTVSEGWMTTSP